MSQLHRQIDTATAMLSTVATWPCAHCSRTPLAAPVRQAKQGAPALNTAAQNKARPARATDCVSDDALEVANAVLVLCRHGGGGGERCDGRPVRDEDGIIDVVQLPGHVNLPVDEAAADDQAGAHGR